MPVFMDSSRAKDDRDGSAQGPRRKATLRFP